MGEARPRAIGELLTELMARRGFARVKGHAQCEQAWREAVGPFIAERSRIGASRRGVLEVVVASSMLVQEIGFQKTSVIAALRRLAPDEGINDLRVRVGRID